MKKILLKLISVYKKGISPLLPNSCRFEPTCSEYAAGSINRFGVLKGSYLALHRILRCNPFYKHWGCEPVPDKFSERTRMFKKR